MKYNDEPYPLDKSGGDGFHVIVPSRLTTLESVSSFTCVKNTSSMVAGTPPANIIKDDGSSSSNSIR
ncbi:hypothetical protein IV203_021505 [Nitzschia inconspicua]|uniref:Uncharacterized protein n=1 Tax=Nitzschia inconspicua TaxID=303405 RepID=A0A9K3KI03_9STRA|nr:hypothetical protein IV203_022703 [Nitzschia inconspicua]KAG7343560.1 hypothetical protein IV203_021505 [Nitzschia inconspicua]